MSNIEKANEFKALGNEAFKNKNYEDAIKYFSQAIEANPNDHVFYSNRSGSYLNAGQHQKALEDAEQCVKMNNTWPRGYQRKGTALFYLDQIDDAIATYKEGLVHDPNNQQLKNDLESAEKKKNEGANPMMNEAYLQGMMKLIGHPETKDFLQDPTFMQKVQTIMQNPASYSYFANDPKIKKAFEVINSNTPNNFDFQNLMKNMGKKENAPKQEEPPKQQETSKMDEEPIITEEKTESKAQAPKKPQQKQSTKMDIEDPAEDAKNKGNQHYKKKQFTQAIKFYDEAIAIKPEQPLYYNNKAAAYLQMAEYEKAHQALNEAQALFQEGKCKDYVKKAKVFARRATVYNKQHNYDEAIASFEKSLVEDNVPKVRDELRHAKKLKKEREAKQYINPELAQKACEEGNSLFKEGKFPAALQQYEEAIKRNPQVAKYYSNLGTVYIKLMEWGRAKENFETALKKDSGYIKAYAKKGDCHYAMKQFHKALETYEAGLKIDSNNELCKLGVQKTQQAIYSSGGQSSQDQQQRAQRAMADPEIQAILSTPEVRNALTDLQNDPKAITNIMKNPSLAQKIQKLIQAGVIGTG